MIKVLYIAPLSIIRQKSAGGVESATENILDGFSRIDELEVIVLSFRSGQFDSEVTKYSKNITIIQSQLKTEFSLYDILFGQKNIIKKLIEEEKPDLIHFHGTGPNILSIRNLAKERIIITQHGINRVELKFQDTLRNKLKYLIKTIIEITYFPKFLNYIFISRHNFNITQNHYKTNFHNYAIIPNSVSMNYFNIKSKNGTDNQILYVGFISRLKNLLLLIKVINKLKNNNKIFKLIVVGKIKDYKYYEECRQYIIENELTEMISFKGHLDQKQLLMLYNKIDLFVLPSLQENSPISILEAMAAAKVSIAPNIGGIPEMINNNKTGYLFEKNNAEELYKIIAKLDNNYPLMKSIGSNAQKHIFKKYNPQHVGGLMNNFYKSIINE